MIFLDPRAGSQNYVAPLRALGAAVDDSVTLDFGDACFYGSDRTIGVELKKLNDLLNCIVTGRFSGHQLPGLARDYQEAFLVVEGLWRPNPQDGVLEVRRGQSWVPASLGKRTWMYRDLDNFLTTIEIKGGVRVKRTASEDETARVVFGLYNWFQDYDGHKAHLALHRSSRDESLFTKPTLARRVAAELPGIGFEKSGMIAGKFPRVIDIVTASEDEWRQLPGIGKKLARQITEAISSVN